MIDPMVQHRTMTGGQDKAVAIQPLRITRIDLDEFAGQDRGDIRHSHRHPDFAACTASIARNRMVLAIREILLHRLADDIPFYIPPNEIYQNEILLLNFVHLSKALLFW